MAEKSEVLIKKLDDWRWIIPKGNRRVEGIIKD
jgi:hypothetical protein